MLRDGALSNAHVIQFVNENLVPVWVNVREDRFPRIPATLDEDWLLVTSPDGQVMHPFFLGYLAKSYVLTPDLYTLLNEEDGIFGRSTLSSISYMDMLDRAVRRWKRPPAAGPT